MESPPQQLEAGQATETADGTEVRLWEPAALRAILTWGTAFAVAVLAIGILYLLIWISPLGRFGTVDPPSIVIWVAGALSMAMALLVTKLPHPEDVIVLTSTEWRFERRHSLLRDLTVNPDEVRGSL